MSIDIRAIKVMLDTNIPGKALMPLKKSMMYNPELNANNFDEYPYFTMDVPYPESYLSTLPYQKQMDFFFIKSEMTKILRIYNKDVVYTNVRDDSTFIRSTKEEMQELKERQQERDTKQKDTLIKDAEMIEIRKLDAEILDLEKKFIADFEGYHDNTTVTYLKKGATDFFWKNEIKEDSAKKPVLNEDIVTVNNKKISTIDDYVSEKKSVIKKDIDSFKGEIEKLINESVLNEIFEAYSATKNAVPKNEITKRVDPKNFDKNWRKCAGEAMYKKKDASQIFDEWKRYITRVKTIVDNTIHNKLYASIHDELKKLQTMLEKLVKLASGPQLDYTSLKAQRDESYYSYDKDTGKKRNALKFKKDVEKDGILPDELSKLANTSNYYIEHACKLQVEIEEIFNDEFKAACKSILASIDGIIKDNILDKEYISLKEKQKELRRKLDEKKRALSNKPVAKDSQDSEQKNKMKTIKQTVSDVKREAIIKQQLQYENSEKNIMIMLRLMFPTKYPFINNIFESFSAVILKNPVYSLKFIDFLPGFLKSKIFEGSISYSYLKIDGKVYTIAQTVWLNDIYNHKEYSDLVEKFDKLKKWKAKEMVNITLEIDKKREKFKNIYISGTYSITSLDIENLESTNKKRELAELGNKSYELVTQYTTYNQTLENLIQAIKDLNGSIEKEEDYSDISDHAKNIATYYNILTTNNQYRIWFNPKNKTKFDKFIANLNKDIEEVQVLEYILEVYFERPGINLDYEKDEPKYRDKLKEKYRTYTDFAENIKKFRAPIRESSNFHLQQTINEFLDNTEKPKGIFNYIMNPYNMDTNPFTEYLKKSLDLSSIERETMKKQRDDYARRFNTGVTILPQSSATEPYFEVYVQVNVIGGELNDANKSNVDCIYQGESLGDKLEYLLNETMYNRWDLDSARIFFDMLDGSIKKLDDDKAKKPANTKGKIEEPAKPAPEIRQQGGGLYTRKARANFMKTRKLYS